MQPGQDPLTDFCSEFLTRQGISSVIPLIGSWERNECRSSNMPIEPSQQMPKQEEVDSKVDMGDK